MKEQFHKLIDTVLEYDLFSEDVLRQAEWVIVDTVAALLYGLKSETEITRYLKSVAKQTGETDQWFPVLGSDLWVNRKDSLLIHGAAIVSNELDEGNTFAKGHPSAHILPSLVISAYENNATIYQVLKAYIKAYEISSRLARASRLRDDMHPHGTWGNIGGAVARALIEGKNAKAIKETILIALSLPLSTTWLAAEKGQSVRNLYSGIGSFLAYESVNFYEYGFVSDTCVAEYLWSNIMGDGFDVDYLTGSLMHPPLITKNYLKRYPFCRFTHASIDATFEILAGNILEYENIEMVRVETYNLAARCHCRRPKTKLQSKFSIPYAIASVIMGVNLFDDYETNLLHVGKLAENVFVRESENLTRLLPDKRAARVEVILKDGTVLEHTTYTAKGEYNHRFSEEELWNKYKQMLQGLYNESFICILQSNLLDLRSHLTFREWLKSNQLTGE